MTDLFLYLALLLPCAYINGVSAFNLTVLHTNDLHARVDQTNKYSSACSKQDFNKGKCYGGIARIKSKVDEIRGRNPDTTLFLDGGDQSQGTMWFFEFGSTIMSRFMNLLEYDAMALGNHEFDNDIDCLVKFAKNVTFPLLATNLNMSREPELKDLVQRYAVFTRGGQQIGVVGYITEETKYTSKTGNVEFTPVIAGLQAAVDELRGQGINKIIAVGHAGITLDQQIAKNVFGVDIVIGGHSNTFLYNGPAPSNEKPEGPYPTVFANRDNEPVLVVQAYAFGKYLGHLEVQFDDNGVVTSYSGQPILLDNATPRDPDILAVVKPLQEELAVKMHEVIGKTSVFLQGDRSVCRVTECNLGNMLTDAMVHENLKRPDTSPLANVRIALLNGGGIRSTLPRGDITLEDLLAVQPFRNTVDVVEVRGETILEALEYSAARRVTTGDLFGGFLQVSGMRIVYNMSQPVNQRVMNVKVLCSDCQVPEFRDLQAKQVYQVLMPTFTYKGGDGYTMFEGNILKLHLSGDVDSTITRNYIESTSPLHTSIEGRIRFVDDENPFC